MKRIPHNYPKNRRVLLIERKPVNTTGCDKLDKAGVSAGMAKDGIDICLECERPVEECPLYKEGR